MIVDETRVFIPASLVSDSYEKDLSKYKDQDIEFVISEFNPKRRRIIGDRKQLLVAKKLEQQKELFAKIKVGDVMEGTVKNVTAVSYTHLAIFMNKIIVIGGGPAGMFAAIAAAETGSQVILLEKNEKLGKKLFITGKGRCNITNAGDMDNLFANVRTNGKSGAYTHLP